jgi:adhesin/invasin
VKVITILLSLGLLAGAAAPPPDNAHVKYFRQPQKTAREPRALGAPVVVNAASFLPGICPGSIATIFGQNLIDVNGIISAGSTPLPLELGGVSVYVNGVQAPLFAVAHSNGEDQINFQVPFEAPTGPGAAQVEVASFGDRTASVFVDSFTEDPGIFVYNGYAIAVHVDGSFVTPSDPAARGETVVLYTTGLGPVTVDVPDGYPAPSEPLAYTADPFQVLVEGEQAQVLFSGLAPGFVGVYQLNVVLPGDLPPGDLDLQISTPYATSGVVKLSVF